MYERHGLRACAVWILYVRVWHRFLLANGLRNAGGGHWAPPWESNAPHLVSCDASAHWRKFAAAWISRRVAIREKLRYDERGAKSRSRLDFRQLPAHLQYGFGFAR